MTLQCFLLTVTFKSFRNSLLRCRLLRGSSVICSKLSLQFCCEVLIKWSVVLIALIYWCLSFPQWEYPADGSLQFLALNLISSSFLCFYFNSVKCKSVFRLLISRLPALLEHISSIHTEAAMHQQKTAILHSAGKTTPGLLLDGDECKPSLEAKVMWIKAVSSEKRICLCSKSGN